MASGQHGSDGNDFAAVWENAFQEDVELAGSADHEVEPLAVPSRRITCRRPDGVDGDG